MNSEQLLRFKAIANSRTLTEAAESLFITQSALSHSLKSLEKELGCELFNRKTSKIMTLTPQGHVLLEYANLIEDLLSQATKVVRETNIINVSAVNICTALILAEYPKDQLDKVRLMDVKEAEMPNLLFNGVLDVAICDDYAFKKYYDGLENKNIDSFLPQKTIICKESLALLVPEGHPLYERKTMSYEELGNTKLAIQASANTLIEWVHNIKNISSNNQLLNTYFTVDTYSFNLLRDVIPFPQLIILNSIYDKIKEVKATRKYNLVRLTGYYSSRYVYLWYLEKNKKRIQLLLDSIKKFYLDPTHKKNEGGGRKT